MNNIIKNKDCPICFDLVDLENNYITTCNHLFCKECIDKWFECKNTCPVCRTEQPIEININNVPEIVYRPNMCLHFIYSFLFFIIFLSLTFGLIIIGRITNDPMLVIVGCVITGLFALVMVGVTTRQ